MLKRALISVFYKDGVLEMAKFLQDRGVEIVSTGGTYKHLKDNGINVIDVTEVTNFPEMLDGRVKTLNPYIHGGILAIRDNKEHMETIKEKEITPIDLVIVNLYPFFDKVKEDLEFEEKVEFIDIGGPTMLRAAAKNFQDVIVISDKNDYKEVMTQIVETGDVSFNFRKKLAGKVFNLMSAYDGAIANFLLEDDFNEYYNISYNKVMTLRYGENSHQSAAYYSSLTEDGAMNNIEQLNGKELSYNNIKDMDIAWKVVNEFTKEDIVCCGLKHNTPCGVALGENVYDAYMKAYECDPVSIFGGIVAFNKKVDKATAEKLAEIFLEIVIAPEFDADALEVLNKKKNLRVIRCNHAPKEKHEFVKVDGGLLVQESDKQFVSEMKTVTKKAPTDKELKDLEFAMKVVKYVKSNAIVVAKDGKTLGIGGGQVNRIWAAEEALERANTEDAVVASDAFFPFGDVVEACAKYKVSSIIQPGGSIRDNESIENCDKFGMSMIFTGLRHFKH